MRRIAWLGLGAVLAVALPLAPRPAAKDYRITSVAIEARLTPDGGLEIEESRTFAFGESFRYARRTLPLREGVSYRDIRVGEAGRDYRPADTGEPGTFRVTDDGREIEVRWFFRARGTRTFTLRYRVDGAVRSHEDAAVLYYQFIGADWGRANHDVRVDVRPPAPLPGERVRAWLHGPLWAELTLDAAGGIAARCARVPPHTFLEIRALYPPDALPGAPREQGRVRSLIEQEEAAWAEAANRARAEATRRLAERAARRSFAWRVLPAAAILGLGIWFALWRSRGARPAVPESAAPGMTAAPPTATPPALVGYLLHDRQVGSGDLTATVFDLARRGHLVLHEGRREQRRAFGGTRTVPTYTLERRPSRGRDPDARLLAHESALLAFLFDELAGGGDRLDLAVLQKKRNRVAKFFATWSRQVKAAGRERGYYDEASIRGMHYGLLTGAALLALTIPAALLAGPPAVILAGAGVVVLVLSALIPHRTAAGEAEARQWQGLRRYLRSCSAREVRPHLDALLVYGIALGLGAKGYRALLADLSPADAGALVPWYAVPAGLHASSPGGFAAAFSSMVATANSGVSSAAGTGGGASGGGGGGAGGGGGGAG
jgi:hypothetical protein